MTYIRSLVLFLLVSAGANALRAQGWDRSYPTGFDPESNTQIIRSFPDIGGGFTCLYTDVFTSQVSRFGILKVAAGGAVLADTRFDFGMSDRATDMLAVADDGFAVLYTRDLFPAFETAYFILRLDAQLQIRWNREIGRSADGQYLTDLDTRPGGFLANGSFYTAQQGYEQALTLNLDHEGLPVSSFQWGPQNSAAWQSTTLNSGTKVVVGSQYVFGSDTSDATPFILLARLSADGQLLQETALQPNIPHSAPIIQAGANGQLTLAGDYNGQQAYLSLLDSNLNLLWERYFPEFRAFRSLATLADGSGYWALVEVPNAQSVRLLRLDAAGNVLFSRGLSNIESAPSDLLPLADGGCLINTARIPVNADIQERIPRLIRVDSNGNDYTAGVSGTIYFDENADCQAGSDSTLYGRQLSARGANGFIWWTHSDSAGRYTLPLEPGQYTLYVGQPNAAWVACADSLPITIPSEDTLHNLDFFLHFDPQPLDSVCGLLFRDFDGDCEKDIFEPVQAGWTVTIGFESPDHLLVEREAVTDANGHFCLGDLGGLDNSYTGTVYDKLLDIPGDGLNCRTVCTDHLQFDFSAGNGVFLPIGLICDSLLPCPVMEVDIATQLLRPCMPSSYYVQYCNKGSVDAENASVAVHLDPGLIVTGASIPWSSAQNGTYTFALGTVGVEACGNVEIQVFVPCDAPLGTTYCAEAHAYPDTSCSTPAADWDGSHIEVTADCTGDSVVFTIRNVGTGDMQQALDYIVIEDNVLLLQTPGTFQLISGGETTISFPADGAFLRLEARQSPGFPGLSQPVAWVEGCNAGGTVSLGFVNQYPLPDAEPWLDIFCLESGNSYDPNDKNGFPRGYDETHHFISPDTDLEYVIRFQNTGNAPALTVELRDTLPLQVLDITTVRPGAASHPYTFDIAGNGVLVFRFPGINLPDSSVSPVQSQGFVKFRVSQRRDLPSGTEIRNTAAIYFDQNAPVLTNRTLHTIGQDFILVKTVDPVVPGLAVSLAPNPGSGVTRLSVDGGNELEQMEFSVWSLAGSRVLSGQFYGNRYDFDTTDLPSGMYLFRLTQGGKLLAQGKLVRVGL